MYLFLKYVFIDKKIWNKVKSGLFLMCEHAPCVFVCLWFCLQKQDSIFSWISRIPAYEKQSIQCKYVMYVAISSCLLLELQGTNKKRGQGDPLSQSFLICLMWLWKQASGRKEQISFSCSCLLQQVEGNQRDATFSHPSAWEYNNMISPFGEY